MFLLKKQKYNRCTKCFTLRVNRVLFTNIFPAFEQRHKISPFVSQFNQQRKTVIVCCWLCPNHDVMKNKALKPRLYRRVHKLL